MPVNVNRDPFSGKLVNRNDLRLRTPQARVLALLLPERPDDPVSEWPVVTRAQLNTLAGHSSISGTLTRVLNGIREGSSSGAPHPGLLARNMIETLVFDIDGVEEVNYRITALGVRAYQAYVAERGAPAQIKDAERCTNYRHRKGSPA